MRSSPLALQAPRAAQVTVELACFSTPRATMHICTASHTTSVATAPAERGTTVAAQHELTAACQLVSMHTLSTCCRPAAGLHWPQSVMERVGRRPCVAPHLHTHNTSPECAPATPAYSQHQS